MKKSAAAAFLSMLVFGMSASPAISGEAPNQGQLLNMYEKLDSQVVEIRAQMKLGELNSRHIQDLIEHHNPFLLKEKAVTVDNTFRLLKIADGRTTEELVRDGKYSYANPDINSKNFPARARKEKSVKIEFINGTDFDHDPTSEEVLKEAEKRGLKRPVYEDGLYFGVEHPEVQREGPMVFLHEPWRGSGGDLRVVYLWSGDGYRELGLHYFAIRWDRYCRFAFVRK